MAFVVMPAAVPECADSALTGRELALLNAQRKAQAVARQCPDQVVLAADTVVCLGAVVYGKPRDRAEAARMLGELQGRTHQVITGVVLVHARAGWRRAFAEVTDVTFRALSADGIAAYLAAVDPLDKAGAYAIQERGATIVEAINGSFTNVVGLPLERVQAELKQYRAVLCSTGEAGARRTSGSRSRFRRGRR
jgi:septum formation protein